MADAARKFRGVRRDLVVHVAREGDAAALAAVLADQLPSQGVDYTESRRTALQEAASRGHVACVRLLLKAGASVEGRAVTGYKFKEKLQPLLLAAQAGHLDCLEALLDAGADVHADWAGRTALHEAASNGNPACVLRLLAAGAAVDARSSAGHTPLSLAQAAGHHECAAALLAAGAVPPAAAESATKPADPETGDPVSRAVRHALLYDDAAALDAALAAGNAAALANEPVSWTDAEFKQWLRTTAPVSSPSRCVQRKRESGSVCKNPSTPLLRACAWGQTACVQVLLRRGARVWTRQGGTPLMAAAGAGAAECGAALLAAGADPDVTVPGDDGTALFCAASAGCAASCAALLAGGAAVNVRDVEKSSPLLLACKQGAADAVAVLLAAGAAVDVRDIHRTTPLKAAIEAYSADCVALVLQAGIGKGILERAEGFENKFTPLIVALRAMSLNCADELLAWGASISTCDSLMGLLPLHFAAGHGDMRLVEALLAAGADPDAPDQRVEPEWQTTKRSRATCLHYAANSGNAELVDVLLCSGASVDARDAGGITPLMVAAGSRAVGAEAVLEKLLAFGADADAAAADGTTPLMYAAAASVCARRVATLLDAGASPDAVDVKGSSALVHVACLRDPNKSYSDVGRPYLNYLIQGLPDTPYFRQESPGPRQRECVAALLAAGADAGAACCPDGVRLLDDAAIKRVSDERVREMLRDAAAAQRAS